MLIGVHKIMRSGGDGNMHYNLSCTKLSDEMEPKPCSNLKLYSVHVPRGTINSGSCA